jgi:hypothetical protein
MQPAEQSPFESFSIAELQELERGVLASVETLEKELAQLYQEDRRKGDDGTTVEDLEGQLKRLNARLKAVQGARKRKQEQSDEHMANLIAAGVIDPERDARLAQEANLATPQGINLDD